MKFDIELLLGKNVSQLCSILDEYPELLLIGNGELVNRIAESSDIEKMNRIICRLPFKNANVIRHAYKQKSSLEMFKFLLDKGFRCPSTFTDIIRDDSIDHIKIIQTYTDIRETTNIFVSTNPRTIYDLIKNGFFFYFQPETVLEKLMVSDVLSDSEIIEMIQIMHPCLKWTQVYELTAKTHRYEVFRAYLDLVAHVSIVYDLFFLALSDNNLECIRAIVTMYGSSIKERYGKTIANRCKNHDGTMTAEILDYLKDL